MCAKQKIEGPDDADRSHLINAETPVTVGVLLYLDLRWAILGSNQ